MRIARPLKATGRVVLGPCLVGTQYVRLVAMVDGSGLIQVYNASRGEWQSADNECDFAALWSARPALTLVTTPR
ncbi:MAG TPA: hypothetical protein VED01_05910 [Burkholderiales bacterium]|nr:hypothetical protein [Burkholderiales bacterium]